MTRLPFCTLAGLAVISAACAMPFEMARASPIPGPCPGPVAAQAGPLVPRSPARSDTTELRWYRAADARDITKASRWCATVGQPVVHLNPTGRFSSWHAQRPLDVVSWNMNIGGGDLYAFLREELSFDCLGGPITGPGPRPFVLLLQEVWRHSDDIPTVTGSDAVPWTIDPDRADGPGPDIVEVAARCGLALVYVPSARNGPDSGSRPHEDKGNAILSTVTLTAPIGFELPFEAGRKVAVGATVTASGGQRVRVVSVHLDVASTLVRTLLSGNQTRARQSRGVIDGIDAAERDGPVTNAVVVGGDFNTWAGNESALRYMQVAFPESPKWDGLATRGGYPADHMFFRRASLSMFTLESYRRSEETYGSDHHARRAVLSYAPGGPRR